jgi:hypothetical protein
MDFRAVILTLSIVHRVFLLFINGCRKGFTVKTTNLSAVQLEAATLKSEVRIDKASKITIH